MRSKLIQAIFITVLAIAVAILPTGHAPQEDDKYTKAVKLINSTITGDNQFKHKAWEATAYFVDTFGPRLWGSTNLEKSLEYLKDLMTQEGFEKVNLDEYQMAKTWTRGKEKMTLYSPRPYPTIIPMIGLGRSVGGNVTGEVMIITDWDDLEAKSAFVKGKIILFNPIWVDYETNAKYRTQGPTKAAKYGAIACIIKSVAPMSWETVHTGATYYDDGVPQIPAAAISLESAEMFRRMIDRQQKVVVNIYMEAKYEDGGKSHNIIGQITGTDYPNEIILLGGHLDSWDVGPQTGANDDAGGFFTCYEAIRFLIKNNLKPKRTIRLIGWTGEEFGDDIRGATDYIKQHKDELKDHLLAFENDEGTKDLYGWGFTGGFKGYHMVNNVARLFLDAIKAKLVKYNDGESVDTRPLYKEHGIPMMRNLVNDTDSRYYFTYHHSAADTMNIIDPDDMDRNVIGTASMFYILADVNWRLPRD
jgi:carboxypeptidase Q